MAVQYRGQLLRTRQQAAWQAIILLLVLLPLVALRFRAGNLVLAVVLTALSSLPFTIAYQAWRFLREQELHHPEPTPEMTFVFGFLAGIPLGLGALLFILLVELN